MSTAEKVFIERLRWVTFTFDSHIPLSSSLVNHHPSPPLESRKQLLQFPLFIFFFIAGRECVLCVCARACECLQLFSITVDQCSKTKAMRKTNTCFYFKINNQLVEKLCNCPCFASLFSFFVLFCEKKVFYLSFERE